KQRHTMEDADRGERRPLAARFPVAAVARHCDRSIPVVPPGGCCNQYPRIFDAGANLAVAGLNGAIRRSVEQTRAESERLARAHTSSQPPALRARVRRLKKSSAAAYDS